MGLAAYVAWWERVHGWVVCDVNHDVHRFDVDHVCRGVITGWLS